MGKLIPTDDGRLVPADNVIILETHNGGDRVVVSKDDYVIAESRDVIQLLPIHNQDNFRTFIKPFWKVVKQ